MTRQWLFAGLTLACLCRPAWGMDYGGHAGSFLRVGAGARAQGLGCAYGAVAQGPAAAYWNPAGLARAEKKRLVLSHHSWSLDRSQRFLAYSQPMGGAGFGIAWLASGTDDIVERDTSGRSGEILADEQHAYLFSFGKQILPTAAVGLTGKLLRYELAGQRARGRAFDMGVLFSPKGWLAVAGVLRDCAGTVKWQNRRWEQESDREEKLPCTWSVGLAGRLAGGRLLVSVDLSLTEHLGGRAGIGAQFDVTRTVIVRAGVKDLSNNEAIEAAFAAGGSVSVSENLDLDGAYVTDPMDVRGSQVWSFNFRF